MDKRQREFEVVSRLLSAIANAGGCAYEDLRAGDDPPDVVANSPAGLCGFEVTELVDGELALKREHESGPSRTWQVGAIAQAISRIVASKDAKAFKGGPYADRFLCIFTGEPQVTRSYLDRELQLFTAPTVQQFTGAFLLLPFDVATGHCPFVRLTIAVRATRAYHAL